MKIITSSNSASMSSAPSAAFKPSTSQQGSISKKQATDKTDKTDKKINQNPLINCLVKITEYLERKNFSVVDIGVFSSVLGNVMGNVISCVTVYFSLRYKKKSRKEICEIVALYLSKLPADLIFWDLVLKSTQEVLKSLNLKKYFPEDNINKREKKEEIAISLVCFLVGLISNEFLKPIFKLFCLQNFIAKLLLKVIRT